MKNIFLILSILFALPLVAQETKEDLFILDADSTWLKEIIKFPLGFAQEIEFEGYEDLRFAKDWRNPEGSEFFTYAYVWNINLNVKPSVEMIESNLKLYYDGLMTAVNKDKDLSVPKTEVDFNEIEKSSNLPKFTGLILVYDAFSSKKVIRLFTTVETLYCDENNKYLILFRISTKNYDDSIWEELNNISLKKGYCLK